jgi:hypothetical protein
MSDDDVDACIDAHASAGLRRRDRCGEDAAELLTIDLSNPLCR